MNRILSSFVLYILCILCLQAASVQDLYDASVLLDKHTPANSKPVLKQGLLQVLIKVTGNKQVADQALIKNAIENPENYLLKYSQKVNEKSLYIPETDEVVMTKQVVSIQNYSAARITSLLQEAKFPVWGKQRPLTLVWIMLEPSSQNRILLNDSDESNLNNLYKDIVNTEAAGRGIPLVYPMQDLEEQVSTSLSVIWAQYPEELMKASKRYNADAIVSVSMHQKSDKSWSGKWLVISNGNSMRFETSARELTGSIQEGINWLADNLAKVYTTNLFAPSEVVNIKVNNITSLEKYVALDKYLSSLAVIDKYTLNNLNNSQLEFGLSVKNGKKALLETLRFDKKLIVLDDNNIDEVVRGDSESRYFNSKKVLEFRWRS